MSSLGSRLTKLDSDYNIRQVDILPHFASIIIRFSVCAHSHFDDGFQSLADGVLVVIIIRFSVCAQFAI